MRGKVKLTETIKPGVVTFTIGHGQWASGATDVVIDGKVIKGDPKRATGFNANAAMWIDPHLKNTCMIDPVGRERLVLRYEGQPGESIGRA